MTMGVIMAAWNVPGCICWIWLVTFFISYERAFKFSTLISSGYKVVFPSEKNGST